jgi:hypothetical protein
MYLSFFKSMKEGNFRLGEITSKADILTRIADEVHR